mgnify:CR=1 FL=1|jgi:hypothetical protein
MSILLFLIAIGLTWKFLPALFEFILGMFVIQLIWQVIKLIFKFGFILILILGILYFIVR